MKTLVIGSGMREHALAKKLAQDSEMVFVAPGNAGTALEPGVCNIPFKATDEASIAALIQFALHESIDMTIVGPEAPLNIGVVNAFRKNKLAIFGPTRAAAQLECSKVYAKDFMTLWNIPTARHEDFGDADEAKSAVSRHGFPVVVKADGLAAGKGAFVCHTPKEAHDAIDAVVALGEAGKRILIEEFIRGEETSFIVMCDGTHVVPLATSQDHKRLLDHDEGPMTGGMGAISPAPIVTPALHARIMNEIVDPTITGMRAKGTPFAGFLYVGLMIDADGNPWVLEFNVRLGDPEASPILFRLKSSLVDLVNHALAGTLDQAVVEWDERAAVGIVVAAAGYPDSPRKGDVISGLPIPSSDCHFFFGGVKLVDDHFVTDGGRVGTMTALSLGLDQAQHLAYVLADEIEFDGKQMRRDIGDRALKKATVCGP